MLRRLGLHDAEDGFLAALFTFLEESRAPFEQVLFDWHGGRLSADRAARSSLASLYASASFGPVRGLIETAQPRADLRLDHAYFGRAAPCTMLIDEVEAIWAPIAETDDWSRLEAKLAEIAFMAEAYGTQPRAA
jgi:hypothetical protein